MDGQKKDGRGGHREGSGRKWEGRVQFTLTVAPETRKALRKAASLRGTSVGRLVDEIVKKLNL